MSGRASKKLTDGWKCAVRSIRTQVKVVALEGERCHLRHLDGHSSISGASKPPEGVKDRDCSY
eukprot:2941279-Amphidinium_carterae.1